MILGGHSKINDAWVQVFIPTYNRSIKLERAINSVLAQTYQHIKIVILDNCSQDETSSLVMRLSKSYSNIEYIRSEYNLGMIGNFNRIHSLVKCEYFCVLTDDDVYEKEFIAEAISLFKKNALVSVAIFNAPHRVHGVVTKSQIEDWHEGIYRKGEALNFVLTGRHPIITNCLFRHKVADKFIFSEELGGSGDIFLLIKIIAEEDIVVSKMISGYYDIHDDNETLSVSGVKRYKQQRELYRAVENYSKKNTIVNYTKLKPRPFQSIISILLYTDYIEFVENFCLFEEGNDMGQLFNSMIFFLKNRLIFNIGKRMLFIVKLVNSAVKDVKRLYNIFLVVRLL